MTHTTKLHYIDSHCHLDFDRVGEIGDVIRRAKTVGVTRFIVPGVNSENWHRVLALGRRYDEIYPALGIHPCFIEADSDLEQLRQLAYRHREDIVAIGEIGLDGSISTPLSEQLTILLPQLKLAAELALPVICHAHKAYDPLLKQLRQIKLKRGGVVHGFSGSRVQANEFIKLGFKLGIGGVITYPRANKIRTTLSQCSITDILLETDSPDMPLHGQQGRANSSVNIPLIAQSVHELTNIELAAIAKQTNANCCELFDLSPNEKRALDK